MQKQAIILILFTFSWLGGCNPTVRIEAPKEPITVNLNIKIEHEIRVKVDKELESILDEDSDLF